MPARAQLTGVEGENYTGKVKIKVGPVTAEYTGTARFAEKDDDAHRAVIDARGRDARGAGNATALITASLRSDGPDTVVTVDTDLKISGKLAQFGSGMIKEVSEKLLGQFVDCLQGKLTDAPVLSEPVSAAPAPSEVATAPSTAGTPESVAAPHAPAAPATRVIAPTAEPEALDLMALAGGSVYKRLLPVAGAIAVVVAIIVYAVTR